MKKHFTDGLLQLAIVLSLLRTDLNNYLNNLHNYPEVQEILLGSSSAYVQSQNFHNNRWNNDLGYAHPKNYRTSILRELHSLSDYRRVDGVFTVVDTWLVSNGPGALLLSNNTVTEHPQPTSQGSISAGPPDNVQDGQEAEPEGAVAPPLSPDLSTNFRPPPDDLSNFRPPTAELTKEDMDLIDILWRQDMDLGIGREVFDPNLRRDLEKERELELLKQRELEQLEASKHEQQPENESPQQDATMFMVDGETGELVPLAPSTQPGTQNMLPQADLITVQQPQDSMPTQQPQVIITTQQPQITITVQPTQLTMAPIQPYRRPAQLDDTDEGFTIEEAMQFFEEQQRREEQEAATVPLVEGTPAMQEPDDMDVSREIEQFIQNAQQMMAEQQEQLVPVQPIFRTQASFEAALDEVVSLLDMPSVNETGENVAMLDNSINNLENNSMVIDNNGNLLDNNTDGPLISNTTMTAYNPEYNILQQQEPSTTMTDNFTTLTPVTNSTLGLPQQDPSIYNFTQDMNMFTNITNLTGAGQMNDTDFEHTHSLLRQLMEDDPLEDLMDVSAQPDTSTNKRSDSVSCDSAVSSMGSCSPLRDTFSTLSEALEGATGGAEMELKQDHKYEAKYSPYPDGSSSYSDFDSLSSGSGMNYSGSPNGSDPSRSSLSPGDMRRYVKHNHTYPLQPGQQPKESKSKIDKDEQRIATNRDERRAKEMKIPFTTDEIIHSPVERFNEMLQKYHLTEPQLQLIRDIRRRGKNKVAAQNCRKRKIEALTTIEDDIEDLKKQRDKLVSERGTVDKELKIFKDKMSQLYNEVFSSLRDDNGQPYDPSQYSLQQTADGSIILVPRNTTNTEDDKPSTSRRRKGRKN